MEQNAGMIELRPTQGDREEGFALTESDVTRPGWEPETFWGVNGFMSVEEMRHACERAAFMLRSAEHDHSRFDDVTLLLLAVARSLHHMQLASPRSDATIGQLEHSLAWVTNSRGAVSPAALRLQLTHARCLATRLLREAPASA